MYLYKDKPYRYWVYFWIVGHIWFIVKHLPDFLGKVNERCGDLLAVKATKMIARDCCLILLQGFENLM